MIKFAFYTYLPARLLRKATFEEQMIHNFILDFKDGKNYAKKKAARLVGNSISFKDCSNVVFCCIPASSAYATARRYKKFSAMVCELCGAENVPIEIHHVRKLKDLQGKKFWESFMTSRKRKTLALCHKCHVDLHHGKLD
jgi:hypothetical protein